MLPRVAGVKTLWTGSGRVIYKAIPSCCLLTLSVRPGGEEIARSESLQIDAYLHECLAEAEGTMDYVLSVVDARVSYRICL